MQAILSRIYTDLIRNKKLKRIITSLKKLCADNVGVQPTQFPHLPQYVGLCKELEEVKFQAIQSLSQDLVEVPEIIAFIVEKNEFFTLAFLVLPQHSVISWHDHPNMNGITKCLFGELQVQELDQNYFKQVSQADKQYCYPKKHVREQKLSSQIKNLSRIDAQTYNIHKISCFKQAGILDLMMPEYPENTCHFYQMTPPKEENEQLLVFQEIDEQPERIVGFIKLCQIIKEREQEEKAQKLAL